MVGGVAHTSANGAEGDEEGVGVSFLGVSPGGVPGDCREGVGGEETGVVGVRARFLKVCERGLWLPVAVVGELWDDGIG